MKRVPLYFVLVFIVIGAFVALGVSGVVTHRYVEDFATSQFQGGAVAYNGAEFGYELPTEARCWSDVLRDNDYSLGYVGKWHLLGGDRNRPSARRAPHLELEMARLEAGRLRRIR